MLMRVDLISKVAPQAVKLIGKKEVIKIVTGAGLLAGITEYGLNKTVDFAKEKLSGVMENKKTQLMEKRAELMEKLKKEDAVVEVEETPEEVIVEEEPKKASKKKGNK